MSGENSSAPRDGFCTYIDTFCQRPAPVLSDEKGYIVFETEVEAQREIVDNQITRLQQFLDGEREYEDAITVWLTLLFSEICREEIEAEGVQRNDESE